MLEEHDPTLITPLTELKAVIKGFVSQPQDQHTRENLNTLLGGELASLADIIKTNMNPQHLGAEKTTRDQLVIKQMVEVIEIQNLIFWEENFLLQKLMQDWFDKIRQALQLELTNAGLELNKLYEQMAELEAYEVQLHIIRLHEERMKAYLGFGQAIRSNSKEIAKEVVKELGEKETVFDVPEVGKVRINNEELVKDVCESVARRVMSGEVNIDKLHDCISEETVLCSRKKLNKSKYKEDEIKSIEELSQFSNHMSNIATLTNQSIINSKLLPHINKIKPIEEKINEKLKIITIEKSKNNLNCRKYSNSIDSSMIKIKPNTLKNTDDNEINSILNLKLDSDEDEAPKYRPR